jgi:hypothetical protein
MGAVELGQTAHLIGESDDGRPFGLVAVEHLLRRQNTVGDQQLCGAEDRVALVVAGDFGGAAIARFVVGTGMAHQPHRPQMQERRTPTCPHPFGCRGSGVECRGQIGSVGNEIR